MGSLANTKTTLTAAVANNGTLTVGYPAGMNQAALTGSTGGSVAVNGDAYKQGSGVTFAFGATDITITNATSAAWPAGAEVIASFGRRDINGSYNLTNPKQIQDKVNAL